MLHRGTASGALIALLLAFGAGLFVGGSGLRAGFAAIESSTGFTFSTQSEAPKDVNVSQLWKAWHLLEENYIETHASSTTPTPEERLWGAIAGLTASYNDPYTVFLPPQEAKMFQEEISGAFEGVGMELGLRDGNLTVIAPLKYSPAYRAGIKSGDLVLAVDGRSTQGFTIEDAVKRIRGPKGTRVTLTILSEGESEPREVSIIRDTISIPVLTHELRPDGIYQIELYSFSANSRELFRAALRGFIESGSQKLLLDLRGNPGGFLEAAVDMASFFLPVGEVVVVEDFKGNQKNVVHRSLGYNIFANRPLTMAILVDQGSASASEILAGALREHGIAKLVGMRTFGKGSVQELVHLGGGADLKITIARWLTPEGTSISEGGLTPDIEVERTPDDIRAGRDPQKDAALLWLKSQ